MRSCSVKMNSHVLTAFLQAASSTALTPDQVEVVFGAVASFRARQPATAFVYTALLTCCAKQAPERALDVWQALQEVHIFLELCTAANLCHHPLCCWKCYCNSLQTAYG